MTSLQHGDVIGIFGGGQLGRMLSQAARELGFKTHIYDPYPDTPAGRISDTITAAPYEDLAAIASFAQNCDVVTYEFENIPAASVQAASKITAVFPSAKALATSHDRLTEKTFLAKVALAPTVKFGKVESMADLNKALGEFGAPAVLKTRRFGYDGKGQVKLSTARDGKACFARLGGTDLILEDFAPFVREFSIIAARGRDGEIACYPLTENVHVDHRLHTSTAPAGDPQGVEPRAHEITQRILEALDYVGVMGIEFFELEGGDIAVNEIAPRVHNSGHWTQDAGCTDQFEQHIRAIAGLPLGDTTPSHKVEMTNLIGDDITGAEKLAANAGTFVHDYDKRDIRPGRKMGHVNRVLGEK